MLSSQKYCGCLFTSCFRATMECSFVTVIFLSGAAFSELMSKTPQKVNSLDVWFPEWEGIKTFPWKNLTYRVAYLIYILIYYIFIQFERVFHIVMDCLQTLVDITKNTFLPSIGDILQFYPCSPWSAAPQPQLVFSIIGHGLGKTSPYLFNHCLFQQHPVQTITQTRYVLNILGWFIHQSHTSFFKFISVILYLRQTD